MGIVYQLQLGDWIMDSQEQQEHLGVVKNLVESHEGDILPMMFCDLDGNNTIVAVPFHNNDDKVQFAELVRKLIQHKRITFFWLVMESWQTRLPKESTLTMDQVMAMQPMDRPHTKEVMMCIYSDSKSEVSYMADIQTDGKLRALGEWETLPLTTGKFVGLWKGAIASLN
jgi:hypothetical protein